MNGGGQEERRMGRAASAKAQRRGQVAGERTSDCYSGWLGSRVQGRMANHEAREATGTSPWRAKKCHWKDYETCGGFRQGVRYLIHLSGTLVWLTAEGRMNLRESLEVGRTFRTGELLFLCTELDCMSQLLKEPQDWVTASGLWAEAGCATSGTDT